MESPTPALETQNLKHWATRKVQITHDFMEMYSCIMSVIIIKISQTSIQTLLGEGFPGSSDGKESEVKTLSRVRLFATLWAVT